MDDRPLPRRRVDVTLSTPGAEIRLPSVPVVRNRARVLSGLLSAALLVGLILLISAPVFEVKAVDVDGIQRFSDQEIAQAASVEGRSVFTLDPEQIKMDLQLTYPGLTDVRVDVTWPAQVSVEIAERTPVLAWNYQGHVRWVDSQGVAFEPHGSGEGIITVRSTGLPPTLEHRFVDPSLVKAVSRLEAHLPEGAVMEYDQEHGLGWRDPLGWQVYFGKSDQDLQEKITIYQAVTKTLNRKGIQPSLISLEYLDGPFLRME
jgi:cell division protein FtsQ